MENGKICYLKGMKLKTEEYKSDPKLVTINTDASWDQKETAGFGIWIKSSFWTIKRWGKFKGPVVDSNEAEIKALVNAFYFLSERTEEFDTVVVNCDNKAARDIINKGKISKRFKKEGTQLKNYCKQYKKVYAKDIKGHQKSHNSRQYVNNWCDEYSRKGRKLDE